MNKIIILLVLFITTNALAEPIKVEFDEATEIKCHSEIKQLKCTNDADEEMHDCVKFNKTKLSPECLKMHDTKMSNQS